MTCDELKNEIYKEINVNKPREWRDGQYVVHYIDEVYGVARTATYKYGVDCFYNDDNINKFIEVCAKLITELGIAK